MAERFTAQDTRDDRRDDWDEYDEACFGGCVHCEDGFTVVCPDDLCRSQGFCMHGDGMAVCLYCKGEG